MAQSDPNLSLIQQLIIDLSMIDRNHYLAGSERRENDTEHSMTVAVLCWYFHEKTKCPLDIAKILKYAITHDFVEVYAGDVNTFANAKDRAQKAENERAALARLANEFSDFSSLVDAMQQYESREDEESLFVWTVDKMQHLIMGDMDGWRPYRELNISYLQFVQKHEELLSKSSRYCRDVYAELLEYSKTTYYDRPLS